MTEAEEEKEYSHIYKRIKMVTWLPFLFTLFWLVDYTFIPPKYYKESVVSKETYTTYSRSRATEHYITNTQHFKIRFVDVYSELKEGDSVFILGTPIFKDIKELHYKPHKIQVDYRKYIGVNLQEPVMKYVYLELGFCLFAIFAFKPGINSATFSVFSFIFIVLIIAYAFP